MGARVSFWRSKSARTLLITCLILLAGEGVVRVRAYVRHGRSGTEPDIYKSDPILGRVPRPGAAILRDGATTTINRWGLRGHDVQAVKPPGVVRIVCLGASTTFGGPGDDDDTIWPAQLERMLDARASGVSFEVINGAMPGSTVAQSRINLEHRLARFDPDMVLIYHAATDIAAHARRQFSRGAKHEGNAWSLEALRDRYSLAYNLLRINTAGMLASQFSAARHCRLDDRGVAAFTKELIALVDDCRTLGCRVLLCTFPRAYDRDQSAWDRNQLAQTSLFFNPQLSVVGLIDAYERYNAAIRQVAQANPQVVTLIDIDRNIPRGWSYFADSIHLNAAGHEKVARQIADALAGEIGSTTGSKSKGKSKGIRLTSYRHARFASDARAGGDRIQAPEASVTDGADAVQ